jgi:phosphoribosylformylglycinamidine cyclo-ligase
MGSEAGADGRDAYRRAGVDVEAGHVAVSLIREAAARASRPELSGDAGGFAGLFDLGDGRYLAAGTDGVGTKLEIARVMERLDTVGIDLVAMCANDVVSTGAEPMFFLDYLAVERLVPEQAAAIVGGVAEGCAMAGCALLGGETAEHPGTMGEGRFDLAGFCVGVVRAQDVLDRSRVRAGDALIGLRSSGLHSNGFSLVRRVLLGGGDDTEMVKVLDELRPELGRALGEELLEPTRIYVKPALAAFKTGVVRSAAHITGGGWLENLPRALPEDLGAEVWTSAWQPQPIFDVVAREAGLTSFDLFGVLNMGIGMVLVVTEGQEDAALSALAAAGTEPVRVGRVTDVPGVRLLASGPAVSIN